jgi:acetyl-CoA acetyltransferase
VRTPVGKRNGALSEVHPADLGGDFSSSFWVTVLILCSAHVINAILERTKMNPELVDDVIFGCVSQTGAQSANLARKY